MGGVYINNNLEIDDCNHKYPELSVYWMILAGKLNMSKNLLSFMKMFILFYFLFILFRGCYLVEDFNSFRLCSSAASHANTKLPAAKYMAWKFRLLKAINLAFTFWFWEWRNEY